MAITLQKIEELVVDCYGVELSKRDRNQNYIKARCLFAKIAKEYTPSNFSQIGRHMNRDHATAIHCVRNVFDSYRNDVFFMNSYNKLREEFDEKLKEERIKKKLLVDERIYQIESEFKKYKKSTEKIRKENVEVDKIKLKFEEYKKRNARFNELLDMLDTEKKREELFFKLENAVQLLKNAKFY